MDIKERFYANLEVIREQMSSPPIRPSGPPTRSSMNRSMDNKSFVDRASSPQEVARKAKQKAASPGGLNWQERSALGVDMQEAEQLDETGMGMKKFKRMFKGTGPEGTGDPRPMKKRLKDDPEHAKKIASYTGKLGGMAELQRRIAKRMVNKKKAVTGMDEEAEQLDELNKKSMIGKFLRGRKAIAKGYGTFGKAITADTNDQAKKHIRNANRYYNLTTGQATTPKGFPKSTVKEDAEQLDEVSKKKAAAYRDKAHASFNYAAGKRDDDEFGTKKYPRSKESMKKDDKTIQKRLTGLKLAHKRLSVK